MANLFFPNISGATRFGGVSAALILCTLVASCSGSNDNDNDDEASANSAMEITVQELKAAADNGGEFFLIDVRTDPEYAAGHLAFTDKLIDYRELPSLMNFLPQDKNATIYLFCRSGRRSGISTEFLRKEGYANAYNVKGGIVAWLAAGFPVDTGGR